MGATSMTKPLTNPPSAARFWALIPSAGTGSRAGVEGPKQYQPLLGQPLVMHTLAAFSARGAIAVGVSFAGSQMPGANFTGAEGVRVD